MDQKQIDRFFELVNDNLAGVKREIKIILTGAAAGSLMGSVRPSLDIDFAAICDKEDYGKLETAIKNASEITAIPVNYSEDIDRWSQITFLDYKKHILPYKAFGNVKINILSPDYWSIGKVSRYLDPDVEDLVKVLKNKKVAPLKLARLWGMALHNSPRSNACFSFRLHVEHFFKTYGGDIWGKGYNPDKYIKEFREIAGIKHEDKG